MARRSPQTQAKRRRENAKREKRLEKDARRVLRKADKAKGLTGSVDTTGDADSDKARSDSSESEPSSTQ